MDISIGLALFNYRIYLILSQLLLSRPHQVPEILKIHTFANINIRTLGYRNSIDGCCTNGTSLALLARLPHSQAGHNWNHRYWIQQSHTLFRECHQQHRLTAFAQHTLILHFHYTHPDPTPALCISSGINTVIQEFSLAGITKGACETQRLEEITRMLEMASVTGMRWLYWCSSNQSDK